MDILTGSRSYETIRVRFEDDFCHLQLFRPQADNAINDRMIAECREVIAACRESVKIVILEGLPEVFCFGADFKEMSSGRSRLQDAGPLYDLWLELATGPFVSVAHVAGKVNAGGVGFVAACDVVICHEKVLFSLSELLFGLLPACVLPFLTRRIGAAHVNYMTLMTQPITAQQAFNWGLVDAIGDDTPNLLRKHLLRLRRLTKASVARYKEYGSALDPSLSASKPTAVEATRRAFSDPKNVEQITRYVQTGKLPWEHD